ncbi:MAG: hypothetical protein KC417_17315, partial [Myxococcales bacterium]|nr:hypothetical protein [Myxococcales bacterium]
EVTTLVRRIASYGPPLGYRDDDFVLARLAGALAGRPRLRLSPNDEAIVGTWLAPHRLEVTGRAAALLEHVRSELYRTPPDVG